MGDLGKASQVQIPHPHRPPPPLHRRSRFWPYFSVVGAGSGEKAEEGILIISLVDLSLYYNSNPKKEVVEVVVNLQLRY
ncbi:hypothetical protein L6452_37987 [Arctium lappa]|uniref:Uncharacterized protein n=1 Tax=Arctium lappa TaxID=4217 RepID=A0ACB8Y3U5_ARCLA|nr:hypothetical protein L6452_37987 [Arctium lappa]